MAVLVWILVVVVVAIGSMLLVVRRRSRGGGTLTLHDARATAGAAEAIGLSNARQQQSGPI